MATEINGNGDGEQGMRPQNAMPSAEGVAMGRCYYAISAVVTTDYGTVALCANDGGALERAWSKLAGIPLNKGGVQKVAVFDSADVDEVVGADPAPAPPITLAMWALDGHVHDAVAAANSALAAGDWDGAEAALHKARIAAQLRKERVQESESDLQPTA